MAELIGGPGDTGEEPPRIEFPCDYPVKVLGRKADDFHPTVIAVFERHAPGFDEDTIVIRESRKGNFTAMTIVITATGPDQLDALHRDLMDTGLVQMVM